MNFPAQALLQVTTFTINDVEATPQVDANRFSYTPEEGLGNGNHTVVVAVTDGDGNTAQTSVTFAVERCRKIQRHLSYPQLLRLDSSNLPRMGL